MIMLRRYRRGDVYAILHAKVFKATMDQYKKEVLIPKAKPYEKVKDSEVDRALLAVLPEPVKLDTIRTWRYKGNIAILAYIFS